MQDLHSVAYYLNLGQQQEIQELEQFARTGQLVIAISNLLHQLQYERGLSNRFLGSAGLRCQQELQQQWHSSNELLALFHKALANLLPEHGQHAFPARWFRRLGYALHSLEQLPQLRQDIKQLKFNTTVAIKAYSEMIQSLLAVVFEAAGNAADEITARILVAMFNLMQGKELAGQERACGAAGFSAHEFDRGLRQRLTQLINRQDRCFHIFSDYASDEALNAWEQVQRGEFQLEFERLRRLALTASAQSLSAADYDGRWFICCSERLDAIKYVEEVLETQLLSHCQQRILAVREAALNPDQQGNDLQRGAFDDVPSFALYVSHSQSAGRESEHALSGPDDDMVHNISKPVVELIEAQGQRLKSLNDELDAARTELHERKLIDRAKRELIQRRQISEQEAYALLRTMAMNQNRRLVDVAAGLLSMTELL